MRLKFWAGFIFVIFLSASAYAGCIPVTSTSPYLETFETSDGNWIKGGVNSDWAWGTPNKKVINKAAGSTNCWVTGGLTASKYNDAENSWLQSPCFDLSALKNPCINFSILWETENAYDGASLQYSIDGGITWITLGSYADYTNCTSSSWFNTPSVKALGTPGWSGNIQTTSNCTGGSGRGLGAWVTAQHPLPQLIGQANVMFRFTFAAGTQCNDYDGVAIDNISIYDAGASKADFSFPCASSTTVQFTGSWQLGPAPCTKSFAWNFGDAASGANNIASTPNATHIFSAPGTYTVTFTITFSDNTQASASYTSTILNVTSNILQGINCPGDKTGSITANVAGGTNNLTYSWNTSPVQTTQTISNLPAGNYAVTITDRYCTVTAQSVSLTQPGPIISNVIITDAKCNNPTGSIISNVSGGTVPYSFS
ncbi:PKD domain-containing protein [Chitinophagaceae bacterium LWZ2-11]